MPQPKRGDGPWGEAITFWLNVRKWRQADLVRATEGEIDKNTVSRAVNGFDVNTATLRAIAAALKAPLDAVLVSPERRLANEDRRRLAIEVAETVLVNLESRTPLTSAQIGHAEAAMMRALTEEEAAAQNQNTEKVAPKNRTRDVTKKKKNRR